MGRKYVKTPYVDISSPGRFAIEWVNPQSENAYQFSNQKGTAQVVFACRPGSQKLWTFMEFMVDEFMVSPPSTFDEFVAVAREYVQ